MQRDQRVWWAVSLELGLENPGVTGVMGKESSVAVEVVETEENERTDLGDEGEGEGGGLLMADTGREKRLGVRFLRVGVEAAAAAARSYWDARGR